MTTLVVPRPSGSSLWAKAVDELPDENKHGIDFTNSEKIDILRDLLEKAENSRNQFLASRWKYTRKSGETVIMRDLFEKLVRWLDMFKQIGDVAVQYDPMHASLPWAGIRLILQIVVNDTKKLESVMEGLTWISELICRYTIVEALYIHDASAAHKELENAVVKLYTNILSHLSYITEYFGQGTAKRWVKNTGTSHTFDSSLEDIRKSEKRVEKWRSLAESDDRIKQNNKLIDLLNAMNQPLKRIDQSLEKVADNLERSKRIEILRWLSPEPYLGHHKQVKEGLLKGTGKWLLDDPVFKKWRDDSASSILWLHGIAGSGKSKLISIVVDDAMSNFQARNSPQPVFFYCSRDPAEPTRSNPRAILASIARQLSATAPGKPLLKPTVKMYEKEEDEGFASGPPGMKEICELIVQLIEVYPQTTIVIDAMDECDSQKRGELLDYLETILQNASSLVKIFVSSRNDQDIVYKLKSYPNLRIDSRANGKDIALYVEHEVERLIQQKKLLRHSQSSDQLKKLIISETVKGAHEMFRWASMQLQHLSLLTLDDDVTNAVGRLPPDLRTLYNELYDMLSATPGELRVTIFKNALHWVLSAQTKLEPEEFLTAITLIPHEDQRVPITKEQVLDICNNFIVYDSQLRTFRFAHLSVREFLEGRPEFSLPSSNSIIAETCLWTLLYMNPSPETKKILRQLNWKIKVDLSVIIELKGYADLFWAEHCRLAGDMRKSGPLQAALRYLFLEEKNDQCVLLSGSPTLALWIGRVNRVLQHSFRDAVPLDIQQAVGTFYEIKPRDLQRATDMYVWDRLESCRSNGIRRAVIGLFVVCVYDLDELGKELLLDQALTKHYADLNKRNIFSVAAANESCGIMSHLVTQRNFKAAFANEMLRTARYKSGKYVAKVLIEHWKTDQESRKSVLMTAMENCSAGVVEEFLNSWEDVPITQEIVEMATRNDSDNSKLITILRQRRIDFKITQEMILEAIRHNSNRSVTVELLFRHSKADVKITQEMVVQAVKRCSWSIELVKYLLEEGGADVKITQKMVVQAVDHRSLSIELVKYLLEEGGADVKITQKMVVQAVEHSSLSIELVKYLLEEGGADVKITQKMVVQAVEHSSLSIELVKYLLKEGGVDVKITQEMVVQAVKHHPWSVALVECLLKEGGAEVKVTQEMVFVAIQQSGGKHSMVKFLLDLDRTNIRVTQQMIETAVSKTPSGIRMINFLLNKGREDVTVTQEIIETAARTSFYPVDVINFLLNEQTNNIIITEATVEALRPGNERNVLMELFLSKRRKDLPIATPVVTAMLEHLDMEILETLLDECGVETVITLKNIDVVAQRELHKKDMLMDLFKKRVEVLDVLIRAVQEIRGARQWVKGDFFEIEVTRANFCRLKFPKHRFGWAYFVRRENRWETPGT